MADDQTKEAASTALGALIGTGGVAALGVFLKGLLSGATGQEAEVRKALQEENKRLRARARFAMEWEDLCMKSRREAERLGYDPTKWPPDPQEEES